MRRLPKLREFIFGEATTYNDALEIEFVGGHDPTLYWLNRYGDVVGEERLLRHDGYDVMLMLAQRGIFKSTRKPPLRKRKTG